MQPRTMTAREYAALRELQAAELAAELAILELESARERYWNISRREAGRERAEARARAHLRVVRAGGS